MTSAREGGPNATPTKSDEPYDIHAVSDIGNAIYDGIEEEHTSLTAEQIEWIARLLAARGFSQRWHHPPTIGNTDGTGSR